MRMIKQSKSICPECLKVIDATIYEEDNQVFIKKECPHHGFYNELYWSDYKQYERATKFECVGEGILNPRTKENLGCPEDCGLCPNHKSHTALAIIDVTNRCNLRCPVCFATAGTTGYVYEPSKEDVLQMLINLRNNKPIPATALQFSGGEPTIREDLPELIKMAKDIGFRHVEINTNGLRLASSIEFCRSLNKSGVSTIYLQFDGTTSDVYKFTRGADLVDIKKKAIQNCRESGIDSIVLVCTLIKGINDHQLGDILRFAVQNFDVVRCVNVQPVSLCGRIPEQERKKMRITIPDFINSVEEQTKGQIKASDFYPVPLVVPIARAISGLRKKRYVEFTAHPHCGMATYVFIEEGKMVPLTRYANIEKFVESMEKSSKESSDGHYTRAKMYALGAMRHVKLGLLKKYVWPVLRTGSYEALGNLQSKVLMISSMHFMDPYNFDLERIERCCIHYAVPDGRIIPFCTMNSIHRQNVEKNFGVPINQWQKSHSAAINEIA